MDQTPTNSDSASASSNWQPADLLNVIDKYHSDLVGTQVYLSTRKNDFGKVRDFDTRQLTEILNRVHRSSVSAQNFYQSLEKLTGQRHPFQHELLIALHKVNIQLSEYLLPAMTDFRELVRASSIRQIMSQRQNILNQLDKAVENLREANAVVNKIISSVPRDEKAAPADTKTAQDDAPQSSLDQQKTGQSEQTGIRRNEPLDGNHSVQPDSENAHTVIDPLQLFKTPADLRRAMLKALNAEEFKLLSADLGVRYDKLEGEALEMKMYSLIDYFDRRKEYPKLARLVLQFRPDLGLIRK